MHSFNVTPFVQTDNIGLQVLYDSAAPLPSVQAQIVSSLLKGMLIGSLHGGIAASTNWFIFDYTGRAEAVDLKLVRVECLEAIIVYLYTEYNCQRLHKIIDNAQNNSDEITALNEMFTLFGYCSSFILLLGISSISRTLYIAEERPPIHQPENHGR